MRKYKNFTGIFAAVLIVGAGVGQAEAYQAADNNDKLCRYHTDMQERLNHIPKNLLTAISVTESGRWNRNREEIVAWPWTVMAQGKGKFYPSKSKAIAAVKDLQAQGIRNIDVGCMQVNLHYHPDAFENLEMAFDPQANVEYSASFLKRLFKDNHSWNRAAAVYHSGDLDRGMRYMEKVLARWNEIQYAEPPTQSARVKEQMPVQVVGLDVDRTRKINDFIKARRRALQKYKPGDSSSPTSKGLMNKGRNETAPKGKTLQDYRSRSRI